MDLSRWSLERLARFVDRYRDLKAFLADVLEGERSLTGVENERNVPNAEFEVRNDFASLKLTNGVHPLKANEKLEWIFPRLAPFFEAGFLLKTSEVEEKSSTVELDAMFVFGRVFSPERGERPCLEISLPAMDPERVFKGRTASVLKPFRLDSSARLKHASAFAFSPLPGRLLILICARLHLWQVSAVEEAYTIVREFAKRDGPGVK